MLVLRLSDAMLFLVISMPNVEQTALASIVKILKLSNFIIGIFIEYPLYASNI
jgi:hypothetical protein